MSPSELIERDAPENVGALPCDAPGHGGVTRRVRCSGRSGPGAGHQSV